MDKNLKIIFFGTSYFVIPVLEALNASFQIVGVVTAPDSLTGRKQILTPSSIKESFYRLNLNIKSKIFTPKKLSSKYSDPILFEQLAALKPDLIVVSSYGKIIPQQILDLPRFGSLNIHPSLLPKFRGPTPIPAAILAGEKVIGITLIKMDELMDHGPVIYQEEYPLTTTETSKRLLEKIWLRSAQFIPALIIDYTDGKITLKEQNHSKATFSKMIDKEDGYFDIDNPPSKEILDRMIRAYFPWPTAWTKWNEKIVKFYPDGKIQMEGKNPVTLKDFLNGYPDFPLKELF